MCSALAFLSFAGSMYQGIMQSEYAEAQAEAQARAAEQNAKIAKAQGHDAIIRGGEKELELRRDLARHKGNQRATLAANGIDINSGSALDVQNASISEGEYDAAAIRQNAARERWGYEMEAKNYQTQAANARAQGKAASNNALFGSVIGGINNIAGSFGSSWGNNSSPPLTEKSYNYDDRSQYWPQLIYEDNYQKWRYRRPLWQ